MKISAKGRYGLAAMTYLARNYAAGAPVTIISISEKLGISKIYLEQVFSLLKRARLVNSIKGSQGGYQLARLPRQISALDVLSAVETALFDKPEDTVPQRAPDVEQALRLCAFDPLDRSIRDALAGVMLDDLAAEAEKQKSGRAAMFYI